MGIGDRLEGFTHNMKHSAQATGLTVFTAILRVLTGLVLGYVIGIVAQELIGFGSLVILLFVVVTTAAFYKISSEWSLFKVFLFDVFCILVLQILKMYIMLAP